MKAYSVYILASRCNGTLYVGMTNNLLRRVWEHKHDLVAGFTQKYQVHNLVWFEIAATPQAAIVREKQIKEWKRAWKLQLIEAQNPEWVDLYPELVANDPVNDSGCRPARA